MIEINTAFELLSCEGSFLYKKTPATFEVTVVCKWIEISGVGVI